MVSRYSDHVDWGVPQSSSETQLEVDHVRVDAPDKRVTAQAHPPGQLDVAFGALAEQSGSDKRQTGHAQVCTGSGDPDVVTPPTVVTPIRL